MAKIDPRKGIKAVDPTFLWLPTDLALIITDIKNPNNPITTAQIETFLKSLPPQKRAEVVASAKKANTEVSKQFLAAAAKVQ
jgi:hypothetical protein